MRAIEMFEDIVGFVIGSALVVMLVCVSAMTVWFTGMLIFG